MDSSSTTTSSKESNDQATPDMAKEILRYICESNGITVDMCSSMEELDLFMGSLTDLTATRSFPNLKSLCIMKQTSLNVISGLDKCPKLKRLWLTECPLKQVTGLERCLQVQELYLSGNNFTSIGTGLSTLTNLTTLWLNENHLTELRGLESLVSLRVLWACGNAIDMIGDMFQFNLQLEEINLSRNQISSLRDVLQLANLPNLRKLSFRDPHFGANPLCHLCNYQTYMIHHLPNLTSLDAEAIGDESKQLVKAIYTKKKM
jgi:Leucine-rich repeat (LRR) protein